VTHRADPADASLPPGARPHGGRLLLRGLALVLLLALAAAAGWAAGRQAGRADPVPPAETRALVQARADLAAAQRAAAAVRAGLPGLCWAASGGTVTAISAPLAAPGGETCPASAPRFSPVLPEPAPTG
jgi:hypothetical protein